LGARAAVARELLQTFFLVRASWRSPPRISPAMPLWLSETPAASSCTTLEPCLAHFDERQFYVVVVYLGEHDAWLQGCMMPRPRVVDLVRLQGLVTIDLVWAPSFRQFCSV
jgi:hypothetical protein